MIRLPATFKPTHPTGGLPGYPAIDVFGMPSGRDLVEAGFHGTVRRQSGRDPKQGGSPGGAYGWSLYVVSANGDDRYMTHFGSLRVKVGDKVKPGTILGTVCDSAVSGKPRTSHIHYGLKKAVQPIPEPPERLYDVVGPRGRRWVQHEPIEVAVKAVPGLLKKLEFVKVVHADTPV